MASGMRYGYRRSLPVPGFLMNASNPKATIFLLAGLPQFIDPHCLAYPSLVPDSASSSTGKSPATW